MTLAPIGVTDVVEQRRGLNDFHIGAGCRCDLDRKVADTERMPMVMSRGICPHVG
jgi:hypothetical protein